MYLMAWLAFASARDVVVWESPDSPSGGVECEATLDVAADGTVAVTSIVGAFCKKETERLSSALERWRYAPAKAATVEKVTLRHTKDEVERVAKHTAPTFTDAEEEKAGRGCLVHVWIDASGALTRTEVPYCAEGPTKTIEAAVADWVFRPWEATDLWLPVVPLDEREVVKRSPPRFPDGASAKEAKCMALLVISEKGMPTVEVVEGDGCPEAFQKEVRNTFASWRFEKADHASVKRVGATFRMD